MLTELIDKAYQLFAKYKPTRPLDVCTLCCMAPEREAQLASMSVRHIPKDLLAEYNDSAKPAKTRIEEVKHFLPRYLDLMVHFDFPTHSTELSLSRFAPFDQAEWIAEELELLHQFSMEYFKHCLTLYPLPAFTGDIDSILIMFWKAGFNIVDLLTIWEKNQSKESALHFRDLYFSGYNNPFGDQVLAAVIQSWLDNAQVKQHFEVTIETLILEEAELAENDLNELNLLYEMIRVY
jgi:hypothetical protein